MALRRESREPGLPSLNESRFERQRAIVVGKARMPGVPLHFWLWTAVGIAAFGIIYWRVAQGELETARSRVLAKQRAMTQALGPKLFPIRDRIEGWVRELAAPYPSDFVAADADLERVRNSPAIYLRLRLASAGNVRELRKAAQTSLRDGFTSCLFVSKSKPAAPAENGPSCRTIGDCAAGLLCNEWNVCAEPEQPYNVRLVYRTLRVLSSEWTDELHEATSELGLSAYDRDLDNVAKRDVPVTVQLISRAKFFTLVLDEDPSGGVPAELSEPGETPHERIQRVPHAARIGIWDLTKNEPVVRVRAEADSEFVAMGPHATKSEVNLAAQNRQVKNCGLALKVREALEHHPAGSSPLPALTP